jgi:uncharacterized protein YbjQ (UPF0145 family)
MIVTTADSVPGRNIVEVLDIVSGTSIPTRHLGRDIAATFKNIAGAHLTEYEKLMESAKIDAFVKMKKEAEKIGADAVICARLGTAQIMSGAAEITWYGTAVKFE